MAGLRARLPRQLLLSSKRSACSVVQSRPPGTGHLDHGLRWFGSKDELLRSAPDPVLVGSAYAYVDRHVQPAKVRQARKYAAFPSHSAYWESIAHHNRNGLPQCLHEVFSQDHARCLYFDIDGKPEYGSLHKQVIDCLQLFVRWAMCGDRLGWEPGSPTPVVLRSSDPSKYSSHVVFPQIQFRDFAEQHRYVRILLNALPALVVELEGGESVPILAQLVDKVPYSQFQLFRGPYACKLVGDELRPETQLQPEGCFRDDPLSCFAGRVDPEYALALPTVQQLLAWNSEVRELHEGHSRRVMSAQGPRPSGMSPTDMANLYSQQFCQRGGGGIIDFAGLTDLEQYEEAFQWLHPQRASQWWTWFRISGVTFRMLERYASNPVARQRIWKAHMQWSRTFPHFSEDENVEMVRGSSSRGSGLNLLLSLVRFDNPDVELRTSTWQWSTSTWTPGEPLTSG